MIESLNKHEQHLPARPCARHKASTAHIRVADKLIRMTDQRNMSLWHQFLQHNMGLEARERLPLTGGKVRRALKEDNLS